MAPEKNLTTPQMSQMSEKADFHANREVKASAFTTYFSDPENAAKLYAALNNLDQVNPDDIAFTTLSGVLFMARKNDLAFTAGNRMLVISEHQSTINLNMPLRDAIYYGRTMEKLIEPRAMYRTSRIAIPTPEFYVFYNGTDAFPAEKILQLSDGYIEKTDDPMLELKVKVININLPANHPILEKCRPLYEYSWFIQCVRKYMTEDKNLSSAIVKAMKDCEQEGILLEFLKEHGSEAVNMLFTEFNMDDALAVRYEEGEAVGETKGIAKGKAEGQQLFASLTEKLLAESRTDDLLKATRDTDFREKLYQEYGLEQPTEHF